MLQRNETEHHLCILAAFVLPLFVREDLYVTLIEPGPSFKAKTHRKVKLVLTQ